MKKILVVVLFFFVAVHAFSQSKAEKKIAAAVDELRNAMLAGDSSRLANITDAALVYGHSSGKLESQQEFVSSLATGKSDFKTMELTGQQIVVKGSTAVVRHQLTGDVVENGKESSIKLAVLLVWYKSKKGWKLLSRQAVKVLS